MSHDGCTNRRYDGFGEKMALAIIVEIPGGTVEQYDRVARAMGLGGADKALPGMIIHFAGVSEGTLAVVDVWESREAYERHLAEVRSPEAVREAVSALPPFTHREFEVYSLLR